MDAHCTCAVPAAVWEHTWSRVWQTGGVTAPGIVSPIQLYGGGGRWPLPYGSSGETRRMGWLYFLGGLTGRMATLKA